MRLVASCLPGALGCDASPQLQGREKILGNAGTSVDDAQLHQVVCELKRKKVTDIMAQAVGKLAGAPAVGAVAVSTALGSAKRRGGAKGVRQGFAYSTRAPLLCK